MQFLRSNTAVIVTVGPFYDKADGVTIETSLTITNERITLAADTDAGSAPTNILDNVTGATSGTSNDLNYITGNDAGMMQLELSAANTNRVGRMLLSITDAANHVPVFHEYFVLPQAIFDWLTGVIVPLPANVTQFGGSNLTAASGIPEVKVNNIAANAITAASINADAITDAKVASDVTIASVTGNVGGNVTGSVGSVATGGITANSFAADAITAAKLHSDVTTELQSGLATGANLATVAGYLDTEIAAILADTNELQTDWVNGGRLDLIIDAINAKTTNLPSDPADASVIAGRFDTLDTSVADLPTNAELATALGTADDAVLAQIALVKAVTDKVDDTLEDDGGTYRFTENALEQGPSGVGGGGATVEEVWEYDISGIATANLAGTVLKARASQTSVDDIPTNAELTTALAGADDAVLAAIAALNNLSQANIRTALGMSTANFDTQIGDLPTNAELATALGTADDAVLAAVAALNNLSSAQAQTAAAAALAAYDPPTRAELTSDKDEVITQVNANETKIDTLQTSVNDVPTNAELATALGTADDAVLAQVALVKAKTDLLDFTDGNVSANIKAVNDVEITGAGVEDSDEWRPA